jgi:hypothetical protein
MKNLYSPFDLDSYLPYGYTKGGNRNWTLDEMLEAS